MIAVAVNNDNVDTGINDCFGKCEYFFIFDKEKKEFKFLENPAKYLKNKKGLKAAAFLIKNGVITVISGNFGVSVKKLFDKNGVQMVIVSDKYKKLKDINWIK